MSDKDIKNLIDLAELKMREKRAKSEVLETFIHLGMLDANGDYTPLYKELLEGAKHD